MIYKLLLSHWRALAFAILLGCNLALYGLWQKVKKEYIAYGAGVEALGKQALEDKKRIDDEHRNNLEAVKKDYENHLPEVRANAVAAYRANHRVQPGTGQGAMPGIAVREQGHDGAGPEPLPAAGSTCDDTAFIADAAQDALILEQWRTWAIRNKIPMEE